MKKILFLCDGDNYSHGALEFVKMNHRHEPAHIRGLFFSSVDIVQSVTEDFWDRNPNAQGIVSNAIERFANQCKNNNIEYSIEEKQASSWSRLFWQRQSRFADYIVISQEVLGKNIDSKQPNAFMQELFYWAECPLMAVPENLKAVESLILTYDGSRECMHAIKETTRLFPQFCNLPAHFVYVKDEDNDDIPQLNLLREYVELHFKNATIRKLHWDYRKLFSTWVECHENPLIIAGSYNRSILSYLFQSSFSDLIVQNQVAPILIAH